MLAVLRQEALVAANARDDRILQLIREGLKEEAGENAQQGFTWATADTRIPGKLMPGSAVPLAGAIARRGHGAQRLAIELSWGLFLIVPPCLQLTLMPVRKISQQDILMLEFS